MLELERDFQTLRHRVLHTGCTRRGLGLLPGQRVRGDSRPLRLRQDDDAQRHRRARPLRRAATSSSTASPRRTIRDRDWDAYRNNRIGFVFQSLQPHPAPDRPRQRRARAHALGRRAAPNGAKRALEALERVGLADHVNKKPSPDVRRPDAARRHRPRPRQRPRDPPRRRTHRRPRLEDQRSGHGPPARRSPATASSSWSRTTPSSPHQYATRIVELWPTGSIVADSEPLRARRRAPATRGQAGAPHLHGLPHGAVAVRSTTS